MEDKTLHLIILEDNPDDAELIVRELESEGFTVEWSRVDTEEAFRKALEEKTDLILADYNLPSFDGMSAIKIQQKLAPEIPLIIASGTIGEELAVECIKSGATDYVLKDRLFRLGPVVKRVLNETEERRKRREAEEALRESEQFLAGLFESIQDGISVLDTDLTIRHVNGLMKRWYAKHLPLEGRKCYECYRNADKPCDPCPTLRCIESGKTEQDMVPGLPGSPVEWIELFSYPLKDPDSGKVTGVAEFVRDITDRKKAEDQIKRSLKEKETLLSEIHHRVKNNMQVISSLLNLQAGYISDERALELFKECQNRVRTMALIHERLYQSKDLASIDFADYIKSLAGGLLRMYRVDPDVIKLNIYAEDVFLDINTSIPCGLIINELVSNAFKHAFPEGREGEISITFKEDKADNRYTLIVSDDGVVFPVDLDFRETETLGMRLVNILTEQLHGTIEIDRSDGTSFKIVWGK